MYEHLTKEKCLNLIKKDGSIIRFLNEKQLTDEICKISVLHDHLNLDFIPLSFRTKKLVKFAVLRNINVLTILTKEERSSEIYDLVFLNRPFALAKIPREKRTLEICLAAISRNKEAIRNLTQEELITPILINFIICCIPKMRVVRQRNSFYFIPQRKISSDLIF